MKDGHLCINENNNDVLKGNTLINVKDKSTVPIHEIVKKNTLVSFKNDNELISLIIGPVGDISSSSQVISHDDITPSNGKNDEKEEYVGNSVYDYNFFELDPSLKLKIRVKLEITCGSYISNYIVHAGKGLYLRKVNDIKEFVISMDHSYVYNRQHMYHNGKEMIDNSVLDEDVLKKILSLSLKSIQIFQL